MTFTDNMYRATREFYRHGTPYPSGVGMVVGDATKDETAGSRSSVNTKELEDGMVDEGSDGSDDDSAEDDDVDDDVSGATMVEVEGCVNCFPNRPSNTVIVTNESPTIWFRPMEVWEVSFADLSLSRQHTAASGLLPAASKANGRGVALRFPRFIRRRPDKNVEQATTCLQIARLFVQQSKQQQAPSMACGS
jgi:hypothetical protein